MVNKIAISVRRMTDLFTAFTRSALHTREIFAKLTIKSL